MPSSGTGSVQEYNTFVFTNGSNGIIVPQQVYKPSASPYPPLENITFRQGQTPGVNLHHVLNGRQNEVSDGHTRPPTTITSTKIKIRILVRPKFKARIVPTDNTT